jgi:hypothetical protein
LQRLTLKASRTTAKPSLWPAPSASPSELSPVMTRSAIGAGSRSSVRPLPAVRFRSPVLVIGLMMTLVLFCSLTFFTPTFAIAVSAESSVQPPLSERSSGPFSKDLTTGRSGRGAKTWE